jgi:hypothetical protein
LLLDKLGAKGALREELLITQLRRLLLLLLRCVIGGNLSMRRFV